MDGVLNKNFKFVANNKQYMSEQYQTIIKFGWGVITAGSAAIAYLLFYPQKKRAEQLKNDRAAIDALTESCGFLRTELKEERERTDKLQDRIELLIEESATLRAMKCDVKKCPNRNPPTTY